MCSAWLRTYDGTGGTTVGRGITSEQELLELRGEERVLEHLFADWYPTFVTLFDFVLLVVFIAATTLTKYLLSLKKNHGFHINEHQVALVVCSGRRDLFRNSIKWSEHERFTEETCAEFE